MQTSTFIDRRSWILWIAACALGTMLLGIPRIVVELQLPSAMVPALFVVLLAVQALLFPSFLYYAVLRRVIPALSLAKWVGAMLAVGALIVLNSLFSRSVAPGMFADAMMGIRHSTEDVSLLSLGQFLLAPLPSICLLLIPCWLLASASGKKWTLYLAAALVAAYCENVLATACHVLFGIHSLDFPGRSLGSMATLLFFKASLGAVWGVASATTVAWMHGQTRTPRAAVALGTLAGLLLLTPTVLFFTRHGALADALAKMVTLRPAADRSTGSPILVYSHAAEIDTAAYSDLHFAPDGSSVYALSKERDLERIDLATGKSMGKLGQRLAKSERYSMDWSPDGTLLALRTDGAQKATRYQLFSLPGQIQIADYSIEEKQCTSSKGSAILFEADSRHAWVDCGSSPQQSDAISAIRLSVPMLRPVAIRRHGDHAGPGRTSPLLRSDAGILYWQEGNGPVAPLYVHNLTLDRHVRIGDDLRTPELAGRLGFQGAAAKGKLLELTYCGSASDVANPRYAQDASHGGHAFCRTLTANLETGALIGRKDDAGGATGRRKLGSPRGEFVVQTTSSARSKTGQTIVRDAASGRELQRLSTQSQYAQGFSPDGRWLVTRAEDQPVLRIYKVRE
jgi:hypothetical protein